MWNYCIINNSKWVIKNFVESIIEFIDENVRGSFSGKNPMVEEKYKDNQLIEFSSKTDQNKKIKNTEINYDKSIVRNF